MSRSDATAMEYYGAMREHYLAVLQDFKARRAALEAELSEVVQMITVLERQVGRHPDPPMMTLGQLMAVPSMAVPSTNSAEVHSDQRFANISVRWAALWHLYDIPNGEKTGEIADAIKRGGYKSDAGSFANMVSSVLSGMKQKGEVEPTPEGGYRLTDAGRQTWALIRQGGKFREATSPSAS